MEPAFSTVTEIVGALGPNDALTAAMVIAAWRQVAGEMIDWEAPTGGYLLTACFATGRAAARGIDAWLRER